jgi:hypothetical protein
VKLPARWALAFAGLLAAPAAGLSSDEPSVVYQDGLLSIQCADAPLSGILDRIKDVTGMELLLEGSAGNTRLTAQITAQPASLALLRLLEGTGINYLLVADRADPRRVAKMYVGEPTSPATPGRPAASPSAPGRVQRVPRPAPRDDDDGMTAEPGEVPQPAIPDEDDDEQPVPPPGPAEPAPTVATPAPGAPGAGFHPVLDPFGRPIPIQAPNERANRNRGNGGTSQDR